jgi:hypothetical protein
MTTGIAAKLWDTMTVVGADVLTEDNVMLRTCIHGVRHPVGSVNGRRMNADIGKSHHRIPTANGDHAHTECCGCCAEWLADAEAAATAESAPA